MIVYYFREDGLFLDQGDISGPGWPANSTPTSPLPIPDNHYAIWSAPEWSYVSGQPPQYPPADEVKETNKLNAENLLKEVDFTTYADVSDPTNPPYLSNVEDFKIYRKQLREIAVNPPSTLAKFPKKPVEIWSE
jgi:hypothetical protein